MRWHRISWWYRFRRWLVRRLVPQDLTIFLFDGIERVGASNAYDPELDEGWLAVKLQYWDASTTEFHEDGSWSFHLCKRTQQSDGLNRQSSDT